MKHDIFNCPLATLSPKWSFCNPSLVVLFIRNPSPMTMAIWLCKFVDKHTFRFLLIWERLHRIHDVTSCFPFKLSNCYFSYSDIVYKKYTIIWYFNLKQFIIHFVHSRRTFLWQVFDFITKRLTTHMIGFLYSSCNQSMGKKRSKGNELWESLCTRITLATDGYCTRIVYSIYVKT